MNLKKFIILLYETHIDFEKIFIDDNYKDILLRFCQNKFLTTPNEILQTSGPPHNRIFKIICKINDQEFKYGQGKSKKIAEQKAAENTLIYFNIHN